MKSTLKPFWFIMAVFVGVAGVVTVSRLMAPKEIVPWRRDFRAAQEEAFKSKKPLFVYLSATWCPPCDRLKRTTWTDPNVELALRKFVPVQVDYDRNLDLALRFQADIMPVLAVVDETGRTVKSTNGYVTSEEFLRWLES